MAANQSKSPSPDEGLATEQFQEMNQRFYAGDPTGYFSRRFNLLMLTAGKADELTQLLADGVAYEDIRVGGDLAEATAADEQAKAGFITTEAETVLHHASEALLRLFFAHAESPPCPWLECARMRVPSMFIDKVKYLRDHPVPPEQIGRVFLGHVPDDDDAARSTQVRDIERFLHLIARRVLDDKSLYNAAKHGLAVLAGPASLTITNNETGSSFGTSGQSMSFLELHIADDKTKTWRRTTRWLSARNTMWLTGLVIVEMRSLWAIARARYTDTDLDGVDVLTTQAVDDLMKMSGGGPVTRSSVTLAYYRTDAPSSGTGT